MTSRTNKPLQPFRWVGSKMTMMPRIAKLFPPHERYVSLFGGSGADIVNKPRSKMEIYNDLDDDVVNVFATLRDDKTRKRLCEMMILTPYSRNQYRKCLTILQSNPSGPVEHAWAFIIVTLFGFVAKPPRYAKPGAFTINNRIPWARRWTHVTETLGHIAKRFREVVIECLPWQKIIEKYDDPSTLIYADPPYLHETRVEKRLYRHEMSRTDHAELLRRLVRSQSKVVLSGYRSPLYDEALTGWRRLDMDVRCAVTVSRRRPRRTEVVWMNFDHECGEMLSDWRSLQGAKAKPRAHSGKEYESDDFVLLRQLLASACPQDDDGHLSVAG
ncbi:DNA adenine methylase [Anatilimnocola aggregata]|uniref:DNA adenine methylase n=1 Tax=Anatilimnocola aggregata TaxID=2528021 RepID=A0A517YGW7_9BACT|nr:DNA adenine methylase [Anatilimnocola aggregata]